MRRRISSCLRSRSAGRARVAVLAVSPLLLLAGCGRQAPGHVKLPPALSSALQGGAINAGGEAPLWALQIRPSSLTFSSQDVASITLSNNGPAETTGGGVWTGVAGGRPFRALVTATACRDAATGLTYPLTAGVKALGVVYRGCAARAGQGLGPRT